MISADVRTDVPGTPHGARNRRLLAIFAILPRSFEKNAHMLMLKYLRELGWNSTVLTIDDRPTRSAAEVVQWCGIDVMRLRPKSRRWRMCQTMSDVRSKAARGDLTLASRRVPGSVASALDIPMRCLAGLASFPDRHAAAVNDIVGVAHTLHRRKRFNAVVSLYHPLTSHIAAGRFARRHKVPWIAFAQDFFSWDDELLASVFARGPNCVKRLCERRVLEHAHSVAAVNDNMSRYVKRLLNKSNVFTLDHCYDPVDFPSNDAGTTGPADVFRIVSVGLVAPVDEAGLNGFFRALGELLDEGRLDSGRFRVRFVGHGGEIVRRSALRFECTQAVEIVPPVPHDEAMRELKRATCLLFQQAPWGNRRRLAEYFASRKPILAFPNYPDVASAGMIEEYGAGRLARSHAELKSILHDWFRSYISTGRVAMEASDAFVRRFAAPYRAKELDAILKSVAEDAPASALVRCDGNGRTSLSGTARKKPGKPAAKHPDKKRVLWLIKGLGLGGAEKLLCMCLPHLNRDEFEYEVGYFLPWKDALVTTIERHGVPVHCFGVKSPADPSAVFKLYRYLRARHIDILHAHSPWPGIAGRIAARLCGVPVIAYTEHGLWDRLNRLTRWANRFTLGMNHVTIAVSEPVAASIRAGGGQLVQTIASGIDAQAITGNEALYRQVRAELGIPPSHIVVGLIANFSAVKRHEILIEAFSIFKRDFPKSSLVLVGQLRNRRSRLERLAAAHGIEKDVLITGPREDALRIGQAFDIFAMSSAFEGFPVSLLEAMALGKPVVCTNVGGIPSAVTDGTEGFLVPIERPDLLADRLNKLAGDRSLREQMGAAAQRRVHTDFDIRAMTAAVEFTYRRLLEERGLASKRHYVFT